MTEIVSSKMNESTSRSRHIAGKKIVQFQQQILGWFEQFGRHHLPWRKIGLSAYEIVIAEVLLQRTKAETVEKFYWRFLVEFPDWKSISNADIHILENSLKPIGLYRQRAKRIKDLAQEMVKRQGVFPSDRSTLESIPLLGQYIANAIELQLFNKPSPLIDVNMARVLERFFGPRYKVDIRYDQYLQTLSAKVVDHPDSKKINWAILDFAAKVCKAKMPLCKICPLSTNCKFAEKALSSDHFSFH